MISDKELDALVDDLRYAARARAADAIDPAASKDHDLARGESVK
jgi:hypothetical protein